MMTTRDRAEEVLRVRRHPISLQVSVLRTFAQLRADGLQPLATGALATDLLAPEQCLLRKALSNGNRSTYGHLTGRDCAVVAGRVALPRCWASGMCARRLSRDLVPMLLRRYAAVAAGSPRESHLVATARMQRRMLLIGDSVMSAVAEAAACEMARGGLSSREYSLQYFTLNAKFNQWGPANNTFVALVARLATMAKTGGGVAVAIFPGLHFNDPEGSEHEHARTVHAQYRAFVAAFAGALGDFAGNANCTAVLFTPTSQHFPTPSGAYRASKMSTVALGHAANGSATGRGGGDGRPKECRPWSIAVGSRTMDAESAVAAAGEALRPADWPLAAHSANSWRAEELARSVPFRHDPRVLVAPLHWLTSDWHDLHPGYRGKTYGLDCTHWCYSPFTYEPIWWAIRAAVEHRARR